MDNIFLNLINISITASYIAIAVIIFRFLLKKAPKAYTCILWLLVGLRLIIPVSDVKLFSFTSRFSLIPSSEVLPYDLIDEATPMFNINSGIELIDKRVNYFLNHRYAEGITIPTNTGSNIMNIFGIIWISVFIVIIIYAIGSYIYFRRKSEVSICVKGNAFICDYISTPFILGILKPKILLPSTLGEEESRYVLAHEKAHLKRLDNLWKPIAFILLAVHWFNPIMWISYILFCRDIELACDEYVIKKMNTNDKKAYTTALLNCSIPKKLISAYPLAFGEIGVKERIKAILKYKKPAVITSIIAVILCIITAVCFLSNPQKTNLKEAAISDYTILGAEEIYIDNGKKEFYIENKNEIINVINNLEKIEMSKSPILDRTFQNGDKIITIYHNNDNSSYYSDELNYLTFHFNKECKRVWIDPNLKPSDIYKVDNPETVLELFESIENNNNIESNRYKKYLYLDNEKEVIAPCLRLYEEDMYFHFTYSLFSSTFYAGNYEIKDNKIILKSYSGSLYTFEITENGLIFDAENSTELHEYKYSSNEDAESPVPNGAFFELVSE